MNVNGTVSLQGDPALYVSNALSLAKPHALEQLEADLIGYSIDAALINETHLKHKHTDGIIKIDGYNIIRRDRVKRRAGGVAVILHSTWNYTVLEFSDDNRDFEIL